jgi:predicted nucleic acid-binding protein
VDEGEAFIWGLIEEELLPELYRKDRTRVRALMAGLPCLETVPDIWTDVTDIQERALAQSLGPFSIPDLVLAAVALRHKVPLFSLDTQLRTAPQDYGVSLGKTLKSAHPPLRDGHASPSLTENKRARAVFGRQAQPVVHSTRVERHQSNLIHGVVI